jgi:hypothetical protein
LQVRDARRFRPLPDIDLVPTDWLNLHHEPANFHSVIFAPPSAIVHGVARGIGGQRRSDLPNRPNRAHITIQYPSHLGNVGLGKVS